MAAIVEIHVSAISLGSKEADGEDQSLAASTEINSRLLALEQPKVAGREPRAYVASQYDRPNDTQHWND